MRIGNLVLVFKVGIEIDGSVSCIRVVSGHPIFVPAAMQSIKSWRFWPMTIGGQARPAAGRLVLSVYLTERGFETKVLDEEPPRR